MENRLLALMRKSTVEIGRENETGSDSETLTAGIPGKGNLVPLGAAGQAVEGCAVTSVNGKGSEKETGSENGSGSGTDLRSITTSPSPSSTTQTSPSTCTPRPRRLHLQRADPDQVITPQDKVSQRRQTQHYHTNSILSRLTIRAGDSTLMHGWVSEELCMILSMMETNLCPM